MRYWISAVLASVAISSLSVSAEQSSCIECHLSTEWVSDTTIVSDFITSDIHRSFGLDCSDCHGGDPTLGFEEGDPDLAMAPAKGYRPPPGRLAVPAFCARCHSDIEYMKKYNPRLPVDQLQLYKTSIHGKSLYRRKDTKVAVCTDCHRTHGTLPPSDSRSKVYHNNVPRTCKRCHSDANLMKGYRYEGMPFPTDQFDEYRESVHGLLVLEKGDKSAPACHSCHGNHGATPPNLSSVSAACGECHANNRDFFRQSPHRKPWEEMGLRECEQCHGSHLIRPTADVLLGVGEEALCVDCHDPDSPGYEAAAKMKADVDSLKTALALAESISGRAEKKGVEGGQARFDLGKAKDALTRVRSVVHTFDPERVAEIIRPAIQNAREVQKTGDSALSDIRARQMGLGVSLILVLLVAFMLWRKIKEVDRRTDFTARK